MSWINQIRGFWWKLWQKVLKSFKRRNKKQNRKEKNFIKCNRNIGENKKAQKTPYQRISKQKSVRNKEKSWSDKQENISFLIHIYHPAKSHNTKNS